jgi:hypothetical protein
MQTTEIAAIGGDRVGEASRQNMEERFFFYRIDMFGDNSAINQTVDPPAPPYPYPAQPPLTIL